MSWLSDGVDAISGLFSSDSGSSSPGDSWLSSIGDWAVSDKGLSTILQVGSGLYGGLMQSDIQQQQIDAKKEADKFQYLVELAKLKYGAGGKGGKGGGGGSTRNKNADLIEVLSSGNDQRLKALEQFTAGYVNALK